MPRTKLGGYLDYIDSWRFIAVTLVILSHMFNFPSKGYLGVDIFFVISGYVITRKLKEGDKALLSFYKGRMIKILPPLYLMLLLMIPISFFLYPFSSDFFRSEINSILGFFYNLKLLSMSASYHGIGSSESSPFFHLWSISVEEQFYILWPILFLLLIRYRATSAKLSKNSKIFLLTVVSIFAIVSFGYGLTDSSLGSYFNPLIRAYELLVGAILFIASDFFPSKFQGKRLAHIGRAFLLFLLAILIISPQSDPAYLMKIQTLICVLIVALIFFFESKLTAGKVHKYLAILGKRTYGAYLFHLPVVVLCSQQKYDLSKRIFTLILLVLLVELSYRYFELPVKKYFTNFSFLRVLLASLSFAVLIFSVNQLMPYPKLESVVDCKSFPVLCTDKSGLNDSGESWVCPESKGSPVNSCYIYRKEKSDPVIMVIGDSVTKSFTPGIAAFGQKYHFSTYNQTINGCPWEIYGNIDLQVDGNPYCGALAEKLAGNFKKIKPKYIILSQSALNGTFEMDVIGNSLRYLSKYSENVILLAPPPYIKDNACDKEISLASHCTKIDKKLLQELYDKLTLTYSTASQLHGISYENTFPKGCDNSQTYGCLPNPNNNTLRSANVHLTFYSSLELQKYYKKFIR